MLLVVDKVVLSTLVCTLLMVLMFLQQEQEVLLWQAWP